MQKGKDYIGLGVGAMIFNQAGELLLLKRGRAAVNERGYWEVPGGSVEFGETMVEAIVLEIKEELGVDIEIVQQLLAIDHLIPAEEQHWVATPFLVKLLPGQTPAIMEPKKCDEIGFFALGDLASPLSITTELNLQVYHHHQRLIGAS